MGGGGRGKRKVRQGVKIKVLPRERKVKRGKGEGQAETSTFFPITREKRRKERGGKHNLHIRENTLLGREEKKRGSRFPYNKEEKGGKRDSSFFIGESLLPKGTVLSSTEKEKIGALDSFLVNGEEKEKDFSPC